MRLRPTNSNYAAVLAKVKIHLGDVDQAIAQYETVLKMDDTMVDAWINLGQAKKEVCTLKPQKLPVFLPESQFSGQVVHVTSVVACILSLGCCPYSVRRVPESLRSGKDTRLKALDTVR